MDLLILKISFTVYNNKNRGGKLRERKSLKKIELRNYLL
jgi:hypothetical protein